MDFHGFSWNYATCCELSNLHPRTEISSMVSLTPKEFSEGQTCSCFRNITDGGHYVMSPPYYVIIQMKRMFKKKAVNFLSGKVI